MGSQKKTCPLDSFDACSSNAKCIFEMVLIELRNIFLEAVLKIVAYVQGQGTNRFESGAYTIVFEHFESVCNAAIGR